MTSIIVLLSLADCITAIITSLIAAIVFWFFSDRLPRHCAKIKIQPVIDYDLYLVYMKLFQFIETPFIPYEHTKSWYSHELFTGQIKEEDFRLFLSTKCLTEEHRKIDETAQQLLPVGHLLKQYTKEIEDIINQLYILNHYLSGKQILLCRQILDRLHIYSYDTPAFQKDSKGMVFHPVNPTLNHLSIMFSEVYALYIQLQKCLFKKRIRKSDKFPNHSLLINSSRISFLFANEKYRRVLRLLKKADVDEKRLSAPYKYRALFLLKKKDKAEKALIEYLQQSPYRLKSIRNTVAEIIEDNSFKSVLIKERSEEEYNEMIQCLEDEKAQKVVYKVFAVKMMRYYFNKENKQI